MPKTTKPAAKAAKKQSTTLVENGEYNGKPVFRIVRQPGDEFPVFACGLGKAKAILNHYRELQAWVAEQEAE